MNTPVWTVFFEDCSLDRWGRYMFPTSTHCIIPPTPTPPAAAIPNQPCPGFALPKFRTNPPFAIASFMGFNILMLLLVWSYVNAVRIDPGTVPPVWSINHPAVASTPEIAEQPICQRCKVHKPPRTHHCSSCNRCVLLYDHHCPWINNCVGLYNRKAFLLFLFYVPCTAGWLCLTALQEFVLFDQQHRDTDLNFNMMYLMVLRAMPGVLLPYTGLSNEQLVVGPY